jgi:hypothetical protein
MVVRSINFPVPISALITGSLGQIMPNGGDVSLLKVPDPAGILGQMAGRTAL